MPEHFRKSIICTNCHKKIGSVNYCPNCGQINSHRQVPIKQIFKDLLGDYFTFDSKFFKSIGPLLAKPGHLTNEYIRGRRATYILPLRLYIFTTFLFFFVLSLSNAINPNNIDEVRKHQVTEDSLRQFLKPYSKSIPRNTRERLILDLGSTYQLEKIANKKSKSSFSDSLKKYLIIAKPQLTDTAAAIYAEQIYRVFLFYHKSKNRKNMLLDHEKMDELLNSLNFSGVSRNVFFNWLDSNYVYKKVLWKGKNINITFYGNDTLETGFLRDLEKKAEFIFSQGQKGLAIFLNELIRQIPKLMFFLLPVFALLLKLFFIRYKILYFNHLIFSLHVHSLIFMYLIIPVIFANGWVIAAIIIIIWLHTFLAFKNVYRQKVWLLFLKLNSILFIYFFVLIFSFIGLSIMAIYLA